MAELRNEGRGQQQRAGDVMTRNPETVSEKDSVRDAAQIMANRETGVVPVVDGKKVIGMVTDRDIVVRLVAAGKDCSSARISDVMTRHVRAVKEDTPLDDVMKLMSDAQVRRIPVVDRNDEIIGIVSVGDLAVETGESHKVGKTVTQISEGSGNN